MVDKQDEDSVASISKNEDADENKEKTRGCIKYFACFAKFSVFPPDDDGVPLFCHPKYCPLSNTENYINGNSWVKRLGKCGLVYFDENRGIFFGFASMFTVFAFILTLWGCFSLSTNNSLIQRTYWVGGNGQNTTSGQEFSMYVGLRSFEYVDCRFKPGYNSYSNDCYRQSIKWTADACSSGPIAPACQACSSVASTMWTTAFFSCFGLVLSFLGAQTRMRACADIPVQKLLGVCSEFWNAFSLGYALITFESGCYYNLRRAVTVDDIDAVFYVGPGLYCYAICAISAVIRMVVHWLTPLPGRSGCGGGDDRNCVSHAATSPMSKHVDVEMSASDFADSKMTSEVLPGRH